MCERVALPGGGFAMICGGHHRRRRVCVHCGGAAARLCDHHNADGRTCDAALCERCTTGDGRCDYCRHHAKLHAIAAALPFDEEVTDGR